MSAWNNLTSDERMAKWKEFRESIEDAPEEEVLNSIASFFADLPIGARCVDYYTPESWPNPWELLYHNLFCTSTISLLIYHTLRIVIDDERVEIVLVDTEDDRFLMPLLDKKHIFNIELGKVNNIKDYPKIKIIDDFTDQEIHQVQ